VSEGSCDIVAGGSHDPTITMSDIESHDLLVGHSITTNSSLSLLLRHVSDCRLTDMVRADEGFNTFDS